MKITEIKWNDTLLIPIYVLEDGRKFMPMTGQYAGYYEEVNEDSIGEKYGIKPVKPSPSPSTKIGIL